MEFALSEEQQELASTVRALLDKRADSAAVRAATTSAAMPICSHRVRQRSSS